MRGLAVLWVALALGGVGSGTAQHFAVRSCAANEGESGGWFGGQKHACELRSATLPLVDGRVRVNNVNGGIEVVGEDRRDVALEAKVTTQASSQGAADELLHQVEIVTNGTIEANGPKFSGMFEHRSWSASYKLRVPRHLALQLGDVNGAIEIANVEGAIEASTTNGGLSLQRLAGEVHANTVNGGITATLDGDRWRGGGFTAKSVNGAVAVKAPDRYSAHLVASTVNGGVSVAFPITVQGMVRNHVDTNIGQGGPTLAFETVNGGISVGKGARLEE